MVRLFAWEGVVGYVGEMGGLDLTAGAPDMVVSWLSMCLELVGEFLWPIIEEILKMLPLDKLVFTHVFTDVCPNFSTC